MVANQRRFSEEARIDVGCYHTMNGLAAVTIRVSVGGAVQPDDLAITVFVPVSDSPSEIRACALARARLLSEAFMAHRWEAN